MNFVKFFAFKWLQETNSFWKNLIFSDKRGDFFLEVRLVQETSFGRNQVKFIHFALEIFTLENFATQNKSTAILGYEKFFYSTLNQQSSRGIRTFYFTFCQHPFCSIKGYKKFYTWSASTILFVNKKYASMSFLPWISPCALYNCMIWEETLEKVPSINQLSMFCDKSKLYCAKKYNSILLKIFMKN